MRPANRVRHKADHYRLLSTATTVKIAPEKVTDEPRSSSKLLIIFFQFVPNLNFSRQILIKPNAKFHENPFSKSRVAPCIRTEGHRLNEANSCFQQLCGHT